jgi:hypothetical protein
VSQVAFPTDAAVIDSVGNSSSTALVAVDLDGIDRRRT